MERHHVRRLNTRGDSRGCPPWVHFFGLDPQVLARGGDWSKERMNKGEQSGETTFMLGAVIMDCRGLVDPEDKPFGNVLPLEVQEKNHVLGPLLLHHGPAKEGGARIQGVAQMRFDRLAATSGRGPALEPSGGAVTLTPEKWLSPLPPPHGSPVIGE